MPGHEGTTRTNGEDYSIQGQVTRIRQVGLFHDMTQFLPSCAVWTGVCVCVVGGWFKQTRPHLAAPGSVAHRGIKAHGINQLPTPHTHTPTHTHAHTGEPRQRVCVIAGCTPAGRFNLCNQSNQPETGHSLAGRARLLSMTRLLPRMADTAVSVCVMNDVS